MNQIRLRKFEDNDIELFETWLYQEHVKKWYTQPEEWLNEVIKRETDFLFVKHFIVELEGKAIGFCQFYDYAFGNEIWHGTMKVENAFSIDYMIGESDYLGKGYGTQIILKLEEEIRTHTKAENIIVQPDLNNEKSRNTLNAAGFLYDSINDVFYKSLSNI